MIGIPSSLLLLAWLHSVKLAERVAAEDNFFFYCCRLMDPLQMLAGIKYTEKSGRCKMVILMVLALKVEEKENSNLVLTCLVSLILKL